MIAIAITSMVGSAILLGISSSVEATYDAEERTIATGIAEQLIDEVLGQRYVATGDNPYQYPLSASSWEQSGQGRERFNDTDDYHGFTAEPVEGIWGNRLGQGDGAGGLRDAKFQVPAEYFSGWRQEIELYYVDESDPSLRLSGSSTSNLRAVEVRILRQTPEGNYRELVNLRRVFAYVPAPQ